MQFLDPAKQLCIVPDKSLNFLPFAALISSSGKYLIEDFQLEQAASANVFVRSSTTAAAKEQTNPETLLSVGNPELNKSKFLDLADLPEAAREAKEVAEFYKPAMVLTGADASRARVIRDSARADVIHFATHAVADAASPLASKLVLASGSDASGAKGSGDAFEAFDIYGLHLPRARLIVLSACQSGIDRLFKGEGAVGLARPFIAAGVPLVVASLWPVESNATADLMISFHRYRKSQNLSTVAALRMAQLDMIHHSPNSENGYGWAAFTAIGGYAAY
jgi:CHAT domain-containing protein